jgi:cytosine/adenosine deaminase-related metal-dependent hydrolase
MNLTSLAKSLFPSARADLLERGNRLITESVSAGVTSLRAHVEVDSMVGMTCLEVGLELKEKWAGRCEIQIAGHALRLLP